MVLQVGRYSTLACRPSGIRDRRASRVLAASSCESRELIADHVAAIRSCVGSKTRRIVKGFSFASPAVHTIVLAGEPFIVAPFLLPFSSLQHPSLPALWVGVYTIVQKFLRSAVESLLYRPLLYRPSYLCSRNTCQRFCYCGFAAVASFPFSSRRLSSLVHAFFVLFLALSLLSPGAVRSFDLAGLLYRVGSSLRLWFLEYGTRDVVRRVV